MFPIEYLNNLPEWTHLMLIRYLFEDLYSEEIHSCVLLQSHMMPNRQCLGLVRVIYSSSDGRMLTANRLIRVTSSGCFHFFALNKGEILDKILYVKSQVILISYSQLGKSRAVYTYKGECVYVKLDN